MATPHIAGIYAIMKQANPDHTQATAQSAIMTTAYQDPFTFDVPDPFYMGSGHVDVGKVGKGSVFEPGLVYAADYMDYLGFICGVSPEKLGLFNSAITCNDLESRGIHTEASNLNYPSIGIASVTGTKTVVRTVTSVAKENGVRVYKAVVDAPEGYNITIKPDNIRLKKGDEATFEVVVTQNTDDVYLVIGGLALLHGLTRRPSTKFVVPLRSGQNSLILLLTYTNTVRLALQALMYHLVIMVVMKPKLMG